jgi:hypothetical protein
MPGLSGVPGGKAEKAALAVAPAIKENALASATALTVIVIGFCIFMSVFCLLGLMFLLFICGNRQLWSKARSSEAGSGCRLVS